jgi:hypothetical protein
MLSHMISLTISSHRPSLIKELKITIEPALVEEIKNMRVIDLYVKMTTYQAFAIGLDTFDIKVLGGKHTNCRLYLECATKIRGVIQQFINEEQKLKQQQQPQQIATSDAVTSKSGAYTTNEALRGVKLSEIVTFLQDNKYDIC